MEHISPQLVSKVQQYQPPATAIDLVRRTAITLLVGVTAAGKDTVKHHLLDTGGYRDIVSHTTRAPRLNRDVLERNGEHYHFIDFATAERMVDDGAFIEAKVVHFENIYGTSTTEIAAAYDQHKIAITDLDVQGVAEYMRMSNEVRAIFLLPPDYDTWLTRLTSRYGGVIDQADLRKRMRTAEEELVHALETDYFYFVQNSEASHAAAGVDAIARGTITKRRRGKEARVAEELLGHVRAFNASAIQTSA